jgi:hypothetical protein
MKIILGNLYMDCYIWKPWKLHLVVRGHFIIWGFNFGPVTVAYFRNATGLQIGRIEK